jgi:hypothetical protein
MKVRKIITIMAAVEHMPQLCAGLTQFTRTDAWSLGWYSLLVF